MSWRRPSSVLDQDRVAGIIEDYRSGMSDAAFRPGPPVGGLSCLQTTSRSLASDYNMTSAWIDAYHAHGRFYSERPSL